MFSNLQIAEFSKYLTIIQYYLQNNWLELLGFFATIICVWLNTLENIWGWFWAIVSSGIYVVICWQSKLYSDMQLQIVFIVLSIYGWYEWLFGGKAKTELPVSKMPTALWLPCIIIFVLFTLASGYFHDHYTDANLPYIDSSLTGISLIAQWMMARKYLENWILWIMADVFYPILFWYRDLNVTSILYILLLLLAIKGYQDWKKSQDSIM